MDMELAAWRGSVTTTLDRLVRDVEGIAAAVDSIRTLQSEGRGRTGIYAWLAPSAPFVVSVIISIVALAMSVRIF